MTIAIFSSLPQSASSSAASSAPFSLMNAVEGMEGDSVMDFTQLLIGQLTAVLPENLSLGAAFESMSSRYAGHADKKEEELSADTLALLAVLSQIPDPRDPAPIVEQELSADEGEPLPLLPLMPSERSTENTLSFDDLVSASGTPSMTNTMADAVADNGTASRPIEAVFSETMANQIAASGTTMSASMSSGPMPGVSIPGGAVQSGAVPAEVVSVSTPNVTMSGGAVDATATSGALPSAAAKFAASPDVLSGKMTPVPQENTNLTPVISSPGAMTMNVQPAYAGELTKIAVPTSFYDPSWSGDFAQKVTWMATQRNQTAELTLNPPALGSIEVSIKLDNSTSSAVATFVSGSAEVRETIEAALPRLREMLAGAGIELGQAQVSAESFRQAPNEQQKHGKSPHPREGDLAILADAPTVRATVPTGAGSGLVDMFV